MQSDVIVAEKEHLLFSKVPRGLSTLILSFFGTTDVNTKVESTDGHYVSRQLTRA